MSIFLSVALVAAVSVVSWWAFDDGPVYPDHWDPRVADFVEFVEDQRGHDFDHPVEIYFLSPERYAEIAGGGPDAAAPTPDEIEYSEKAVAQYRALGLMQGAPDLNAATETLQDSGTLAFYSPEDDVVNVRGTEMTPGLRVTLVHELTHALQDQHFDLSAIAEASSADESGAARAVVEGDAVAVENAYIETMSEADVAAYEAETQQSVDQADTDLADVPDVLQVVFGSYYAVGNAFVDFWQADSKGSPVATNIDEVLENLPDGSYQLFEPEAYSTGVEQTRVESPSAPGEEEWERGFHGVDLLYVMLSERVDPFLALTATDGWRGDSYLASLDANGRMCVRTNAQFATPTDSDQFRLALAGWIQTMPPEASAAVDPVADPLVVGFVSCDPGPAADMHLTGQAGPALAYPVTRLQAAASAVTDGGKSRSSALCFGQALISKLTLADLQSDERTPAIEAAVDAATTACP